MERKILGMSSTFFVCCVLFFSTPVSGSEGNFSVPYTFYEEVKQRMEHRKNEEEPYIVLEQKPVPNLFFEQNGGNFLAGPKYNGHSIEVLMEQDILEKSVQIGDFSKGVFLKKSLLEDIQEAIDHFYEYTGVYPVSLDDFSEYTGIWWAEISVGERRIPISNLSENVFYSVEEKKINRCQERREDIMESMCSFSDAIPYQVDCCAYPHSNISAFSLTLGKSENKMISLSEISYFFDSSQDIPQLESEAISPFDTISNIARLVPADSLFIYFPSAEKYRAFSYKFSEPFVEIQKYFPFLKTPKKTEQKMTESLAILNVDMLFSLMDEFAFISEDIHFFPHSDFALIVKWKQKEVSLFTQLFVNNQKTFGKVGEYFVFSSDKVLFEEIVNVYEGRSKRGSLLQEKDFSLFLNQREEGQDGYIFLSHSFLQKIFSPTFTIGNERKKIVVSAMNTLQYVIWVYKDLEGAFPKSISEIEEKGYIRRDSVFQAEKYSVDKKGIVHHSIWGTPFSPIPVSRVAMESVFDQERVWYEREKGKKQYLKFFPSLGISFFIADISDFSLYLFPSQGKDLQKVWEGISKQKNIFSLLRDDENLLFQGVVGINGEKILHEILEIIFREKGMEMGDISQREKITFLSQGEREKDRKIEEEVALIQEFLQKTYRESGEYPKTIDEIKNEVPEISGEYDYDVFTGGKTKKERQCYRLTTPLSYNWEKMERDLGIDPNLWEVGVCRKDWDQFPLKELISGSFNESETGDFGEVFDFLGDEFSFGVQKSKNGFGIYFGILLQDTEKAEHFFALRGVQYQKFFPISLRKTKEHMYKEKKYYEISLHEKNIYITFLKDRMFFSTSQEILFLLMDEKIKKHSSDSSEKGRNVYISWNFLDLSNVPFSLLEQEKNEKRVLSTLSNMLKKQEIYAKEYALLRDLLGKKFMKNNFLSYPSFLEYHPQWRQGKIVWEKEGVQGDIFEKFHESDLLGEMKKIISYYREGMISFFFSDIITTKISFTISIPNGEGKSEMERSEEKFPKKLLFIIASGIFISFVMILLFSLQRKRK
jgi:hypothetical protein